jgi:hypothetical protein
MAKMLTVTINNWIHDAIELKRAIEERTRSDVVNELLCKALLQIDPVVYPKNDQNKSRKTKKTNI